MDSEFPDPDEEYEMRYAEELEMMNELDFEEKSAPILPKGHDFKVKKSLNFEGENHGSRPSSSLSGPTTVTSDEPGRKRMQDEVFGSLSDDDELCGESTNPSKRAKNDERTHSNIFPEICLEPRITPVVRPKRYVFKIIPPEHHQVITSPSGQKLYIRFKSDEMIAKKEIEMDARLSAGKLLKVSIQSLKLQMNNEMRAKTCQISDDEFERRLRDLEKLEYKTSNVTDKDAEISGNDSNNKKTDLWMETYRPKIYLDLLSEETVNRTLLHWLKLWDKAVFNREVKIKPPKVEEFAAAGQNKWGGNAGRFNANKKFEKFRGKKANDGELKEELDSTGRPLQKIVLISGPPGLGKTTLAHVVARHAGYHPVEMNASDERNVESFKLQLEAATQMRSVVSSSPAPNCLIIDEIDGAPPASINYLVNALHAQDHASETKQAKKGKKKGSNIVTRPVICICNDLYTPSLRPLRQSALVLQFPPTNGTRLAQRLLSISKEQSMQADMSTMLALCEKADFDIRSCLATLYFLKSRQRPLRYSDIINLNIGHKDNHKSLFQVWQEIFHIPRPKKSSYIEMREREEVLPMAPDVDKPLDPNLGNVASMPARFANILHSVHSCGEYDRLLQGVFENYPTIKFKDSYLGAVCTSLDWMCFFDHFNAYIQHNQDYSVYGYLPYTFVALHFQFAAVLGQKIKYPMAQTEMKTKLTKNQNIVSTMFQDLKPSVRNTVSKDNVVYDIIPYCLPIITPTLRPVSAQLYTAEEKEQIHRVMSVMISYNLTFRQEKTVDGVYRYCLEPDVEQVAYFDPDAQRKSLTYSVKQMLAREIELEKLRQYEANLGPLNSKPVSSAIDDTAQVMKPPAQPAAFVLKPRIVPDSYKPATDFFGRPLKTPPKKKNADGSIQTNQNDVWYHFKEGYSNAVRRNVKITEFI